MPMLPPSSGPREATGRGPRLAIAAARFLSPGKPRPTGLESHFDSLGRNAGGRRAASSRLAGKGRSGPVRWRHADQARHEVP